MKNRWMAEVVNVDIVEFQEVDRVVCEMEEEEENYPKSFPVFAHYQTMSRPGAHLSVLTMWLQKV